jgi:hypothetical protein
MRSSDVNELNKLNERFKSAVNDAKAEENKRWNNRGAVSVAMELVGLRPAGFNRRFCNVHSRFLVA